MNRKEMRAMRKTREWKETYKELKTKIVEVSKEINNEYEEKNEIVPEVHGVCAETGED